VLGTWAARRHLTKFLPRAAGPLLISWPSTPRPLILQEGAVLPKDEARVWPKATSRWRSLGRRSVEAQKVAP
jgi:hypothetical protein